MPWQRGVLRLTFAECYSVPEAEASNWIRAPRTFGRDLSSAPMLNVLKGIGRSTRLGTARFAPTPSGLLITWKPGQRRFVPWSELQPVFMVTGADLFSPDSIFPAKNLVSYRNYVRFSMLQCPNLEIMISRNTAAQLVDASDGQWRQING